MCSDSVDGAIEKWNITEATPNTEIMPAIGITLETAVDTEYGLTLLDIPGW